MNLPLRRPGSQPRTRAVFHLRGLASRILACAAAVAAWAAPAATQVPPDHKEEGLLLVLKTNAPPDQQALACKQLAVWGTKRAVAPLARLLADERLAAWARIALEAIPGSAPDAALRDALAMLQGKLLVGAINSIAFRRDPRALRALARKLESADPAVACASAEALGRIGGAPAAKALKKSLASAPADVRPAVAEGCILCAERCLAEGNPAEGARLYDIVRAANVTRPTLLQATRGAILARQSAGLPLLLEVLRSTDKALFGIGLRTARELPGQAVTEALAEELRRTAPERQAFLLVALAERDDPAALPAIVAAARGGPKKLRLVAIGLLESRGDLSTVPVLLETAAQADADLTQAALDVLTRLGAHEVEADLLARLPGATGKTRQVLIQLAGLRRIDGALSAVTPALDDSEAGVRAAAARAIGLLGDSSQATALIRRLEKTGDETERADLEAALVSIAGRNSAACSPPLLLLAKSDDAALRRAALHCLAAAGGSAAREAVSAAVEDRDESVQDEAVRTLSTWPDNWPEDGAISEPLLALARSAKKTSHQVLALRGYIQFLRGDKLLTNDERLSRLKEIQPLLRRPEEQRRAITALGEIPTRRSVEMLAEFADDPAVAEDACSALVTLAGKKKPRLLPVQRQKAAQIVIEKSQNAETKQKARALLKEDQ